MSCARRRAWASLPMASMRGGSALGMRSSARWAPRAGASSSARAAALSARRRARCRASALMLAALFHIAVAAQAFHGLLGKYAAALADPELGHGREQPGHDGFVRVALLPVK